MEATEVMRVIRKSRDLNKLAGEEAGNSDTSKITASPDVLEWGILMALELLWDIQKRLPVDNSGTSRLETAPIREDLERLDRDFKLYHQHTKNIKAIQPVEVVDPTIVVAALIYDGERFLIGKRPLDKSYGGKWEFPGGKLEKGEFNMDALTRELQEELGIEPVGENHHLVARHVFIEQNYIIYFYLIHMWEGYVMMKEHTALMWLTAEEIKALDPSTLINQEMLTALHYAVEAHLP